MSQQLRRRLTTSLAVLATALSSAIGVGAVTATTASATSSVAWQGSPSQGEYWDLQAPTQGCYYCDQDALEQQFVAATTGPLAKVTVSTPYGGGGLHVTVQSAESFPNTGATLISSDVSSSTADAGNEDETTTFSMSSADLTAGTSYVLVVTATSTAYARVGAAYLGYDANTGFAYRDNYGGQASWYTYGAFMLDASVYESDGTDPPTVSVAVDPATPDGNDGWYKTAPTVSFTCADDLAVTDCPADYTAAEGTNAAITGSVHDNNGNSADYSIPAIKVDTTPPTVSIGFDSDASTADGTYDADTGWYLDTPDFTGSCEEGATCTTSFVGTSYLSSYYCLYYNAYYCNQLGYWLRTATDAAGNVATAQTGNTYFNPGTPTISGTVNGVNAAGWSNGGTEWGYDPDTGTYDDNAPTTSIQWSCASQYAAVTTCAGNNNETSVRDETPVDGTALSGTVTDASGKTSTGSVTVKVDKTPPTITPDITGTVGDNGWYTSPVTVSWACDDALSGVKSCSNNTDSYSDEQGTSTGSATDVADNTNGASVQISSDTIAPVITGTVVTDKGYGGVYDDPITVHWTCSDPGSGNGVSGIATCPADTTVTGVGADTVASATVLDNAGNATVGTISHLFRRVDAPAITVTGALNGHTYDYGSTVTPSCTAVSGSGDTLDCTGTTEGGSADGSGLYVYTATATDPITHLSSTKTVQWIVAERAAVALVIGNVNDGGDYAYGTSVKPSCAAADADGHSVTCVGHTTGGDSDGSGMFTYRATAVDAITGISTTARVSWTVATRPAPQIAITGVVANTVYPYGSVVSPACAAADAKGDAVDCDGVTSSHKLAAGGTGYVYKVTAADPVTDALSVSSVSWSIAPEGKLSISGLPTKTKSGKPVLLAGKAYRITVSFAGSTTSSAASAPYWLKPVTSNAAGSKGTPATITGTFAPAANGSYTWTFTPTKAMHGTFRKFGVMSSNGVVTYQTVYVK